MMSSLRWDVDKPMARHQWLRTAANASLKVGKVLRYQAACRTGTSVSARLLEGDFDLSALHEVLHPCLSPCLRLCENLAIGLSPTK